MPELMDIMPVAPATVPARPAEQASTDKPGPAVRESPAIVPSFRFIPSPAPELGQRWLDTYEIARLYAEAAQRSLITGAEPSRLTQQSMRVTQGEQTQA